jgi:hypothetical protein
MWLLALGLVVVVVAVGGLLYWTLSPETTSWSSDFCQPVTRVGGSDAVSLINNRSVATEAGFGSDLAQLRQDVAASLAHAPTNQLRSELVQYDKSLRNATSRDAVERALSRFDLLSSTQLAGCGIRPTNE